MALFHTITESTNFLANIGPKLALKNHTFRASTKFENRPDIPFLNLTPTTPEEVPKKLNKISDSKATGEDRIPIRFLEMVPHLTSKIITHIINLSLSTSQIPERWKTAIVKHLFKEGDRDLVSNYRPTSILPCMSKITESWNVVLIFIV